VTDRESYMFLVESDLERLGALWLRHEANELFPFLGQGVAVLLRQALERLDHEHHLLRVCFVFHVPRTVPSISTVGRPKFVTIRSRCLSVMTRRRGRATPR
jgi:hypothetical protein